MGSTGKVAKREFRCEKNQQMSMGNNRDRDRDRDIDKNSTYDKLDMLDSQMLVKRKDY